jgi:hypothetical protein
MVLFSKRISTSKHDVPSVPPDVPLTKQHIVSADGLLYSLQSAYDFGFLAVPSLTQTDVLSCDELIVSF